MISHFRKWKNKKKEVCGDFKEDSRVVVFRLLFPDVREC